MPGTGDGTMTTPTRPNAKRPQPSGPDETLFYRMDRRPGRVGRLRRLHLQVVLGLLVLTLLLTFTVALRLQTARVPAIQVTPEDGSAATEVLVRGSDFPAFARLQIRLGPPMLGRTPHPYAEVIADGEGRFVTRFILPATRPDGSLIFEESLEIIVLADDGSSRASASFAFRPVAVPAPELVLTPGHGLPGAVITATGRYFPPGQPLTLQLRTPNRDRRALLQETISDGVGTFSLLLTIPEAWPGEGERLEESDLLLEAVAGDTVMASAGFLNLGGAPAWASYRPLDETVCAALQDSLSARLELPVQRTIGPLLFAEKSEARGQSCQLALVVPEDEAETISAVVADLLQSRGWTPLTPSRLEMEGDVAALHHSAPAGDRLLLTVELAEPDTPAAYP